MPDVPENALLLTAGKYVKGPAELNDGGCFEPFVPQVPGIPRAQAGPD